MKQAMKTLLVNGWSLKKSTSSRKKKSVAMPARLSAPLHVGGVSSRCSRLARASSLALPPRSPGSSLRPVRPRAST